MDPDLPAQSPDRSDEKPSFRKPSHDAANRKYRRHTPIGGSDSSSSEGSPKRRSRSPVYSDDRRRKDNGRELERELTHNNRSSRGSDSYRHSDRHSYGTSHDYARNAEHNKLHRHADEDNGNYHRSSRSGREARGGTRYEHARHDSNYEKSREVWRGGDKYTKDKPENLGHRTKDKDHRQIDKDSERAVSGSRQMEFSRDDSKTGERHRDREVRDERRDRHAKDSTLGRDSGSIRSKETLWSGNKEIDVQQEKRKHNDRDSDKHREKHTREAGAEMKNDRNSSFSHRERDERNERYPDKAARAFDDEGSSLKKHKHGHSEGQFSKSIANVVDEKTSSSSKEGKEAAEKVTLAPASAAINQAESIQDVNAAKVAAMKAAELVNRNLVGGSYLSADQKKKLLWGNKKNTATEESGNRWDLQLFPDRERQEKFNKLMGVKGEAVSERKPSDKDAEQQEKLQMDLEKQYTAGLRRRDGRTVGLGL